jgi:hypothetical protein
VTIIIPVWAFSFPISSYSPLIIIESDIERKKYNNRSPTPRIHSNDHTLLDQHNGNEATDTYVDEMKKGTSNILV